MGSRGNESGTLFYSCIQGLLKSWTALQLAVTHSFAGLHSNEKAQWLVGVLETFFNENSDLEVFEVEEFLAEIMSNEFNLISEDDSTNKVCVALCNLYKLWSNGEHDKMKETIKKLPCVNLGDCIPNNDEKSNNETETDETINELSIDEQNKSTLNHHSDKNSERNIPDEDGWVHVSHKKRH